MNRQGQGAATAIGAARCRTLWAKGEALCISVLVPPAPPPLCRHQQWCMRPCHDPLISPLLCSSPLASCPNVLAPGAELEIQRALAHRRLLAGSCPLPK